MHLSYSFNFFLKIFIFKKCSCCTNNQHFGFIGSLKKWQTTHLVTETVTTDSNMISCSFTRYYSCIALNLKSHHHCIPSQSHLFFSFLHLQQSILKLKPHLLPDIKVCCIFSHLLSSHSSLLFICAPHINLSIYYHRSPCSTIMLFLFPLSLKISGYWKKLCLPKNKELFCRFSAKEKISSRLIFSKNNPYMSFLTEPPRRCPCMASDWHFVLALRWMDWCYAMFSAGNVTFPHEMRISGENWGHGRKSYIEAIEILDWQGRVSPLRGAPISQQQFVENLGHPYLDRPDERMNCTLKHRINNLMIVITREYLNDSTTIILQ
ncbi:putative signal peptide protein [Puccinia sorghi]|uniref:Putative signal peptide protein n=1 Tax=Puccinia sorghi TaxID=27349 RepID=A0A0L6ULS0_9BASI|nr:putative signal peptide protein [Puccinia sorghi]